jgi:hypothetical protein
MLMGVGIEAVGVVVPQRDRLGATLADEVDDILDFIHTLPHAPHYNLSHTAEMRFNRYGKDLQYAFFKRKSSKHTTWYVFFNRKGDRYIIRYITNNHKDGKYIRAPFTEED